MQTNPNILPSTPEVPALAAERLNVINGTRAELGPLAQSLFPVAMGAGVLGIMGYGIKKMFQPILSH